MLLAFFVSILHLEIQVVESLSPNISSYHNVISVVQ